MTITFIIGRRGFDLRINEMDWASAERVLLRFALFRKRSGCMPWHAWTFAWDSMRDADATLTYRHLQDSKMSGWRLRGPLQHF